jgi:hypothetical protein
LTPSSTDLLIAAITCSSPYPLPYPHSLEPICQVPMPIFETFSEVFPRFV